ncbi:LytR/AlgR family response regulator transcription factor [Flavilitoribacter nigricans]|nr:LytTR family DNA-binding domain-containing protein [Flavilitoribacter nigricans]
MPTELYTTNESIKNHHYELFAPAPQSVFVRVQNHLQKILVEEIRWIHADGNYCYIHLDQKRFALKTSLKRLVKKLPKGHFVRIHKSYVVRLKNVEKIDVQTNELSVGSTTLPIGRTFRSDLMDQINIL